ncbi:Ig-like domain (group 3) [Nocardioides terrae]|uniref:Ig-like domain (Group 3) n=1 Tax=Nocardioides terrae TaxID=574651 RepID=A0A1I1EX67_9ACTN|nr:Ig-like domain repeat protein [Nocardioides terrae]SFB90068.1 Ig-like domain (group 3) [Nocardioides terrae]
MPVPAVVDLVVDAPAAAVHRGCARATVTVRPEQSIGPVDGALRVYEGCRVVPGLAAQLHDFGDVSLELGVLPPGWHTLTAAYTGGSRYGCASTRPFTVLVLPAGTITELRVPANGVAPGDSLVVTVRTTDASSRACGTVGLYEQSRLIATGEVVDGIGTVGVPTWLRSGLHRVFAAYSGSDTHCPSETQVVAVAVRD